MAKFSLFFFTVFVFVGCATSDLLVEKNLSGQKGGAVEYTGLSDTQLSKRRVPALARAEQYCGGPVDFLKESTREEGLGTYVKVHFSCK